METVLTATKENLPQIASEILQLAQKSERGAAVIALSGDLGAGKTTLVQVIGSLLGVSDTITSPTFTIMKSYDTTNSEWSRLVHMDAYRIETLDELGPLQFEHLLDTPTLLMCIEWAEKIKEALPPTILRVHLEIVDENTRTVQVT